MEAAYDNRTKGAVPADDAAYTVTDTFAPKGAAYHYTISAGGKTCQTTLTVTPVTASVRHPDTVVQRQKDEGYTALEADAWLPAKITVTYTGADGTARKEELAVTWETASLGADFGKTLGEKTVDGTVELPPWATGTGSASIVIRFVDKTPLSSDQMQLTMPEFGYGDKKLPGVQGKITVGDTNPVYAYLYSTDGGVTWTAEEDLPKSNGGYIVPGEYQVKMTYTGDQYIGEKTTSFTVAKKQLAVQPGSLAAQDKNYDGTLSAVLKEDGKAALSGIVEGDNVTLGGTLTARFTEAGPKKNVPVTVTGFRLENADSGYYELKNTTITLYATINKEDGTPPSDGGSNGGGSGNNGGGSGNNGGGNNGGSGGSNGSGDNSGGNNNGGSGSSGGNDNGGSNGSGDNSGGSNNGGSSVTPGDKTGDAKPGDKTDGTKPGDKDNGTKPGDKTDGKNPGGSNGGIDGTKPGGSNGGSNDGTTPGDKTDGTKPDGTDGGKGTGSGTRPGGTDSSEGNGRGTKTDGTDGGKGTGSGTKPGGGSNFGEGETKIVSAVIEGGKIVIDSGEIGSSRNGSGNNTGDSQNNGGNNTGDSGNDGTGQEGANNGTVARIATGNVPGMAGAGSGAADPYTASTMLHVGEGAVIVRVVCEEPKLTAGVADTVAVANAVLTAEQMQLINGGDTIEIRVEVKNITGSVAEQDQEIIESAVAGLREEQAGIALGMYVDISMFVKVGEGEWNAVTRSNEPVGVVIGIPEEIRADGREYYIIRSHEGECDILTDTDDVPDTITISTDRFSSYAIAYEELSDAEADSGAKCGLCHICPTFLGICCFIWLAVIAAALLVVIIVVLQRNKKQEPGGRR